MLTDQKRREALMALLTSSGATITEANEIIDLGKHAALEALTAVSTVAGRGSSVLIMSGAHMFALRMLVANVQEVLEEMDTHARRDLKEAGLDL